MPYPMPAQDPSGTRDAITQALMNIALPQPQMDPMQGGGMPQMPGAMPGMQPQMQQPQMQQPQMQQPMPQMQQQPQPMQQNPQMLPPQGGMPQ